MHSAQEDTAIPFEIDPFYKRFITCLKTQRIAADPRNPRTLKANRRTDGNK